MRTVNSIEYYHSCPSCGAAYKGKDLCDYCGASMIKKTIREEKYSSREELEFQFEDEDADLPRIQGSNCGSNFFLVLFCSIFGGMFILIPSILAVTFILTGIFEIWLIFMFAIFYAIGIGTISILIRHMVNQGKCKKGEIISGVVRGYENGMVEVNGRPVQVVKVRLYKDGRECLLCLSTGNSNKPYALGKNIQLRNYKNLYIIEG